VRLFIAVPLPADVRERAAALLPPDLPGLKPVRADLMHLTLAFLGWTADERLGDVIAAAGAATAGQGPFTLALDHAGRFPERGRPRVIWLGIGAGADELARLASAVAEALRAREIRFDDRPFAAHLTLARVREDASLADARAAGAAAESIGPLDLRCPIERVAVVQSVLSRSGPHYTERASARLA